MNLLNFGSPEFKHQALYVAGPSFGRKAFYISTFPYVDRITEKEFPYAVDLLYGFENAMNPEYLVMRNYLAIILNEQMERGLIFTFPCRYYWIEDENPDNSGGYVSCSVAPVDRKILPIHEWINKYDELVERDHDPLEEALPMGGMKLPENFLLYSSKPFHDTESGKKALKLINAIRSGPSFAGSNDGYVINVKTGDISPVSNKTKHPVRIMTSALENYDLSKYGIVTTPWFRNNMRYVKVVSCHEDELIDDDDGGEFFTYLEDNHLTGVECPTDDISEAFFSIDGNDIVRFLGFEQIKDYSTTVYVDGFLNKHYRKGSEPKLSDDAEPETPVEPKEVPKPVWLRGNLSRPHGLRKVGDKVTIAKRDEDYKNFSSEERGLSFADTMLCFVGKSFTIKSIEDNYYCLEGIGFNWQEYMFEPLESNPVEDPKSKIVEPIVRKIGDWITVVSELDDSLRGKHDWNFCEDMRKFQGKSFQIDKVSFTCGVPFYKLHGEGIWNWFEYMFEQVVPKVSESIHTRKVGDLVTIAKRDPNRTRHPSEFAYTSMMECYEGRSFVIDRVFTDSGFVCYGLIGVGCVWHEYMFEPVGFIPVKIGIDLARPTESVSIAPYGKSSMDFVADMSMNISDRSIFSSESFKSTKATLDAMKYSPSPSSIRTMSAFSKVEIEAFFSDVKNREAVKELLAKTAETIAVLDAANKRIGEVRSAISSFRSNVVNNVDCDSVGALGSALKKYPEIQEYVESFFKNKIGSFPSKTEPEFDVAKMFESKE